VYLSVNVCSILSPQQFSYLPEQTVIGMDIPQLGNLSGSIPSIFTMNELLGLVTKSKAFVPLYTVSQYLNLSNQTIMEFKNSSLPYYYSHLIDIPTVVGSITWLEITLISDTALDSALISDGSQIPPTSIRGIRAGQVKGSLSPKFISTLTTLQAPFIFSDCFSAFSEVQVSALNPDTFGRIPENTLVSIASSAIPGLTPDQLHHLNTSFFEKLDCLQISNFTSLQIGNMTVTQKDSFHSRLYVCVPLPVPPPPAPFWTMYVIIGFAVGGAVLLFIFGFILYCCCCRKEETHEYQKIYN
jgi:hypothetical protein